MVNYFENYLKAVDDPLPELRETFENEFNFLKEQVRSTDSVLEIGCGIGRPAGALAKYVDHLTAIDNDPRMIKEAKNRYRASNLTFLEGDALSLLFEDDTFDLVYSTYNVIGSLYDRDIQTFVNEMARVSKGKVINITWQQRDEVTDFLKRHHEHIGLKVIEADRDKMVTSHGTFLRLSQTKFLELYKRAGLGSIQFVNIEPLWYAAIGFN